MNKWEVKLETSIEADTRKEAWKIARDIMAKINKDLIQVISVSTNPLDDPDDWIALNNKKTRVI